MTVCSLHALLVQYCAICISDESSQSLVSGIALRFEVNAKPSFVSHEGRATVPIRLCIRQTSV